MLGPRLRGKVKDMAWCSFQTLSTYQSLVGWAQDFALKSISRLLNEIAISDCSPCTAVDCTPPCHGVCRGCMQKELNEIIAKSAQAAIPRAVRFLTGLPCLRCKGPLAVCIPKSWRCSMCTGRGRASNVLAAGCQSCEIIHCLPCAVNFHWE